jgi:hypothetical protein
MIVSIQNFLFFNLYELLVYYYYYYWKKKTSYKTHLYLYILYTIIFSRF